MSDDTQRPLKGLGAFGPAYRRMLERWPSAPGSVDEVLGRQMVLLTPETVAELYRPPGPARYEHGGRPELARFVERAIQDISDEDAKVRAIAEAVCQWARAFEDSPGSRDYDNYRFGGTEESILTRGTDNCSEVSRLACALFQVAGLPARMGILVNTEQTYSGHVVCEVFYKDGWGAVDALTNVICQHPDGRPASLWELHRSPDLVRAHARPDAHYTNPDQFRRVAITSYDVADANQYDYTESPINDYVRAIWKMSDAGWPGGLRWLFGEDRPDKGA